MRKFYFNKLLSKCISGYIPSQLTGKTVSAFQWAIKQNSPSGVGAYLVAMEMVLVGLKAGLGYHQIAAMLQVKTSKNGLILKILEKAA